MTARVLAIVALAATGCASLRGSGSDTARLQSRVNLLEQRVTQLERSGDWQAAAATPTPAIEEAALPTPEATPALASKKKAASDAVTVGSSVKPAPRQVQQALKNAGFYQGSVDGKMGPMTKDAIREFQRVHGLKDDGVVGKQTWTKLSAYTDQSGSNGEAIAGETLK